MSEDMTDRVAKTAWPWREAGKPAADPAAGAARRGLVQAAVMLAIAAILYVVFGRRILPLMVTGLAVVNLVLALAAPKAFTAVEHFWSRAARGVGVAATWALMVPFFYLCFLPARLILLARGRDPMRRRFPSPEPTCWTPRRGASDTARYSRQF
jgi:hypothetical protein